MPGARILSRSSFGSKGAGGEVFGNCESSFAAEQFGAPYIHYLCSMEIKSFISNIYIGNLYNFQKYACI